MSQPVSSGDGCHLQLETPLRPRPGLSQRSVERRRVRTIQLTEPALFMRAYCGTTQPPAAASVATILDAHVESTTLRSKSPQVLATGGREAPRDGPHEQCGSTVWCGDSQGEERSGWSLSSVTRTSRRPSHGGWTVRNQTVHGGATAAGSRSGQSCELPVSVDDQEPLGAEEAIHAVGRLPFNCFLRIRFSSRR